MPHVGWSVEQQATVKRYTQFATFFAVIGVLLSALLIISGNSGGWALLAIIACICLVGYFFPKEARASNPDAISRDGKPMESVAHFVFDDGGRAGWETWRALGLAGYGHRCGSYGSNAKPVDWRHNRGCAVGALAEGPDGNSSGDMGMACVGGGITGGLLSKSASLLPKQQGQEY